jgi:plastocyanin
MDSILKRGLVPGVVFLVLVVVLAVALVGCGGGTTTTSAAGQVTTTSGGSATTAGSDGAAVDMKNLAFVPASITIKVGETVTWTNSDSTAHTVTGDKGEFDSGNMDSGKTFSFTFQTAGTFTYHCTIHPNMTGTVVVQ